MLTFLPIEQIDEMDSWEGSQLNTAKEILAYELTALVHGKEEAEKAQTAARALFSGGGNTENMPTTVIADAVGMGILDVMVNAGLAASKGEARRLVQQGGVSVNDAKVTDPTATLSDADFAEGHAIIKKGKKVYHKIILA